MKNAVYVNNFYFYDTWQNWKTTIWEHLKSNLWNNTRTNEAFDIFMTVGIIVAAEYEYIWVFKIHFISITVFENKAIFHDAVCVLLRTNVYSE